MLDAILKAYVEDLRSPVEIADHYDFSRELVLNITGMVDRNEYKRKQAPPGLKTHLRPSAWDVACPSPRKFPAHDVT